MPSDKPLPLTTLPTVLLWHQASAGSHHDWLLADPALAAAHGSSLWAARVIPSSGHWREAGVFDLVRLPPHRSIYLTYEGPISGDRGTVRRVDEGRFIPKSWEEHRMVLEIVMKHFSGTIRIEHEADGAWRARVV